jgi:hypothetical protein
VFPYPAFGFASSSATAPTDAAPTTAPTDAFTKSEQHLRMEDKPIFM